MFLVAVTLSVIGQMFVIYFPPLQRIFQTEALTGKGKRAVIKKIMVITYYSLCATCSIMIRLQISCFWRHWHLASSWLARSRNSWRGSFRDVASTMASFITNSKWTLYDSYSLPRTKRRKKIITNKHQASITARTAFLCSRSVIRTR